MPAVATAAAPATAPPRDVPGRGARGGVRAARRRDRQPYPGPAQHRPAGPRLAEGCAGRRAAAGPAGCAGRGQGVGRRRRRRAPRAAARGRSYPVDQLVRDPVRVHGEVFHGERGQRGAADAQPDRHGRGTAVRVPGDDRAGAVAGRGTPRHGHREGHLGTGAGRDGERGAGEGRRDAGAAQPDRDRSPAAVGHGHRVPQHRPGGALGVERGAPAAQGVSDQPSGRARAGGAVVSSVAVRSSSTGGRGVRSARGVRRGCGGAGGCAECGGLRGVREVRGVRGWGRVRGLRAAWAAPAVMAGRVGGRRRGGVRGLAESGRGGRSDGVGSRRAV